MEFSQEDLEMALEQNEMNLQRTVSRDEIESSDLIKSGILIFLAGTVAGIGISEGISKYRGKRKIKTKEGSK